MSVIQASTTLKVLTCWSCSVQFALPLRMYQGFEEKPETFYCPKGCRLILGEPDWKKELRRARQDATWYKERAAANHELAEKRKRAHAATKGQLTKTKKRVANGVCPCCNRTVKQLAAHMAEKHPGYVAESR